MTALSLVLISDDETLPLKSMTLAISKGANIEVLLEQHATSFLGDSIKLAPLLLPGSDEAGLYVYSPVPTDGTQFAKNVRATRLAMACGRLSTRFHGSVLLFRSRGGGRGCQDLSVNEIYGAACVSPDLRLEIQSALTRDGGFTISEWLASAAQQNYHDNAIISRLASVMNPAGDVDESDESSDEVSHTDDMGTSGDWHLVNECDPTAGNIVADQGKQFVARASLCLHCRGPCDSLCPDCGGAYFCEEPRQCRRIGYV